MPRRSVAKRRRSISPGSRRIRGHGAYTSYNSLFTKEKSGVSPPKLMTGGDESGSLTISHTEYFADILSSISFLNNSYGLNPGNSRIFPWLSNISQNYEEYQFTSLVFEYRTLTAELSTTASQIGSVTMAVDYNSGNDPFTSLSQMLNYCYAISDKICNSVMMGVECDPTKNGLGPILFVNNSLEIPPGQDIKTYNMGLLEIATNGCTNNGGNIGQLWVHYTVKLMKPKIVSVNSAAVPGFLWNTNTFINTDLPPLNPFGVQALRAGQPSASNTNSVVPYRTSLAVSTQFTQSTVNFYISPNFQLSSTVNGTNANQIVVSVPIGNGVYNSGGVVSPYIDYNSSYVLTWMPWGFIYDAGAIEPVISFAEFQTRHKTNTPPMIYTNTAVNGLDDLATPTKSGWNTGYMGVRLRFPDTVAGLYQVTIGLKAQYNVGNNVSYTTSSNVNVASRNTFKANAEQGVNQITFLVQVEESAFQVGRSGKDSYAPASISFPPGAGTNPPVQQYGALSRPQECQYYMNPYVPEGFDPNTNAPGVLSTVANDCFSGSFVIINMPNINLDQTTLPGQPAGQYCTASSILVTEVASGFSSFLNPVLF